MRLLRVMILFALLLVHPASSRVTGETLSAREESGMASGEDEGSTGLDSENSNTLAAVQDNKEPSINESVKLKSLKLGQRETQVTKLENETGIKRFLNLGPKKLETSSVDVTAPMYSLLSNAHKTSVRPSANIEVDPAAEKPLRKAIVGSNNVPNTGGALSKPGATSHADEHATVKQLDPFDLDCLESHNSYRAKHGVPPLMWSAELAESAQKWADQLASNDVMLHDQAAMDDEKLGENLAYFTPPSPKCERAVISNCVMCREMVQRWYNEIKNYDFDKGQSRSLTKAPYKHFSQIVWANTAEVGVGTAVSKKFGFITVARYRPMGNEGGPDEFVKNVPPEGGPLPTVGMSFEDALPQINTTAPLTEPGKIELASTAHVKSVPKSGAPSAVTPNTAQTQTSSPPFVDKANEEGPKSGGSEKAAPERGFVHTVTAADGTKAQVYLSKKGDHAGIVFRDQISRAHPSDEDDLRRTIQVL